ncbi:MAG: histone H1 [Planctomycetota bacterium]
MDLLTKMEQLIADTKDDYQKGRGGNKAAGTRVRKTMQEIKNVAQEIRQEMLDSRENES